MKLALYQGPPTQGDPEAAFDCLGRHLAASAAAGATMLVAPELYLPGYHQPALHAELSQEFGGDWCDRIAKLARDADCGLTVGWAEREGEVVYNAATVFDPRGVILGHYRKIQLYGPMEKASFAPGGSYCTFEFEGVRAAVLICYDVEFAPHVRALAEQGVKLLLVPTANPAGFGHVSAHLLPARASEMDMTIAYANYCGSEGDLTFGGGSVIVGPDARMIAQADRAETLLVATIDPAIAPELRSTQLPDFRKV